MREKYMAAANAHMASLFTETDVSHRETDAGPKLQRRQVNNLEDGLQKETTIRLHQ